MSTQCQAEKFLSFSPPICLFMLYALGVVQRLRVYCRTGRISSVQSFFPLFLFLSSVVVGVFCENKLLDFCCCFVVVFFRFDFYKLQFPAKDLLDGKVFLII